MIEMIGAALIIYAIIGTLYYFITPEWQRETAISMVQQMSRDAGENASRTQLTIELFIYHLLAWPRLFWDDLTNGPPDIHP